MENVIVSLFLTKMVISFSEVRNCLHLGAFLAIFMVPGEARGEDASPQEGEGENLLG